MRAPEPPCIHWVCIWHRGKWCRIMYASEKLWPLNAFLQQMQNCLNHHGFWMRLQFSARFSLLVLGKGNTSVHVMCKWSQIALDRLNGVKCLEFNHGTVVIFCYNCWLSVYLENTELILRCNFMFLTCETQISTFIQNNNNFFSQRSEKWNISQSKWINQNPSRLSFSSFPAPP